MQVMRADELGMCFGVRDALAALAQVDDPAAVTIHGELVHNPEVLGWLHRRGFPQSPEDARAVPATPFVMVTAHGISERERQRLQQAGKQLLDTTCPLVKKAHAAAQQLQQDGRRVVVLGKPGHVDAVSNAVASGIVADWNGSGRNLCGASNWIPPGAVLDVFQLAVPGLQRLGMLRSQASGVVSNAELLAMREHLATAAPSSLQLVEAVAKDAADLPRAVQELRAAGVDAIWIPIDLTVYQNLAVVRQALGERPLPLVTTAAAGVRGGALVGATVDYALHGRRAATLVHAVLVGGKAPGTLPIDRMRSATVVVNVAAARAAGTELPLSLLLLADELLAAEAKDGKPAR